MERFPDAELTAPHGRLMVLLRNGIAVAGGAFRRYDEQTAELKRIWTHSSYRRQGLARKRRADCTWRRDSRRCSTSPFRRPGRCRSRRPCSF
jgi:hypothetical protein